MDCKQSDYEYLGLDNNRFNKKIVELSILGKNQFFGDEGLLDECRLREHSAIVVSDRVSLLRISKAMFIKVFNSNRSFRNMIQDYQNYKDDYKKEKVMKYKQKIQVM